DDGAYLWGTLLTVRGGPPPDTEGYRAFATWAGLPDVDEGRAFAAFWRWLTDIEERAGSRGQSFRAYCFSRSAENAWMLSSATRFGPGGTVATVEGVPSAGEVRGFVASHRWVDVHAAVTPQFVPTSGSGLKVVAPRARCPWRGPAPGGAASPRRHRAAPAGSGAVHEAVTSQFVSTSGSGLKVGAPVAGFRWRDPEAGGEASLGWYRDAQAASGEEQERGRARILAYNEDDVRATLAVRDWIT